MVPIKKMPRVAGKFTVDHSPTILTVVGVTGTALTAYLTGTASFKAADLIREEQERLDMHEKSHPLDSREKAELIWKLYIPAVGVGICTVTSIIYANRIGNRRTAAMAAAYTIAERAASEYRDKVVETIGKNKEQKIHDELVRDKVAQESLVTSRTMVLAKGKSRCVELKTGRDFPSSMEELLRSQNEINHKILNENYASLSDWYDIIGLPRTLESDEFGWKSGSTLLELDITAIVMDDEPVLAVHYNMEPVRNYWKAH